MAPTTWRKARSVLGARQSKGAIRSSPAKPHRERSCSFEQLEPRALLANGLLKAVLVREPTSVDDLTTGEVTVLPESERSITAWDTFYVELWIRALDSGMEGVRSGRVSLACDPGYASPTAITFGPAFDSERTGWFEPGFAWEVGATTSLSNVGDDGYALLARVRFEPEQAEPLVLGENNRFVGPYDLGLTIVRAEAMLTASGPVQVITEPMPETEMWAVQADVDGNGVVDYGDLSYFASAMNDPENTEPFYLWACDFDRSGVVDSQDYEAMFVANFGCTRGGQSRLVLPSSYLEAWRPALYARLLHDTAPHGGSDHDGVTFDPMIRGQVAVGRILQGSLTAQVDFGPAIPITFGPDGRFLFDPRTVNPNGLPDHLHVVRFTGIDNAGKEVSLDVQLTLDTAAPAPPEFALTPDSDTGTPGDHLTTAGRVDLVGTTEPNVLLQIEGTRTTCVSDSVTGEFLFASVPLVVGANAIVLVAMDQAGNEATCGATFVREFEGDPAPSGMFLKIDGIPGESTDDKHKQWIEVSSFSFGVSQPSSGTAGSGRAGAERCQHEDFRIEKPLDKASPMLALYCNTGQQIKELKLELVNANGHRYMQCVLSEVIVTGVGVEGSAVADTLSETVTFDYGKIEWAYTEWDTPDHAPGEAYSGWDAVANEAAQTADGSDLSEPVVAAAEAPAELVHEESAAGGVQALQAAAVGAFDAFLKIDRVPGESTDNEHKGWIEILSYSHGMSQPSGGSGSSASGARGAERCDHKDFSVVHVLDKASPNLMQFCCGGEHIKDVTLELRRSDESKQTFMVYKLSDVIVSSVGVVGVTEGDLPAPSETVTFNYGKIEWTYTYQEGETPKNVKASWDLVQIRGGQTADGSDLCEPLVAAAESTPELWSQQYASGGLQALQAALSSGSYDAFLKIDGLDGESQDKDHKLWIDVLSFSHGISQPASVRVAGGRTAERCRHEDFSIEKPLDKASPELALFACDGRHIRQAPSNCGARAQLGRRPRSWCTICPT